MGLDQYAYAVMPNPENTNFKYVSKSETEVHLIAEWRKHANLQGWMERLWLQKIEEAGEPTEELGWESFNCQPVRLTKQDIDALEADVCGQQLPYTTGFFFGESCDEDMDDDMAFIEAARMAMASDMEIYYSSWW